jgi:hypothetical protein
MPDVDTPDDLGLSFGSFHSGPSGQPRKDAAPAPAQPAAPAQNDSDLTFGSAHSTPSGTAQRDGAPSERYNLNRPDAAPMEMGEVAKQAWQNLPRSATEFGHAIIQPFTQPKETAEALGKIGTGIYSKAQGALGVQQDAGKKTEDESSVNAIVDFYKNRYGTWENAKRAIAEDPVGVLSDASTIFTGGGALAAKAPGLIGTAGKAAGVIGSVTDPINIALQAPKAAAKGAMSLANVPLALHSGSSFTSLQKALDAGAGANKTFWDHMSGAAKGEDLVGAVKSGISTIADERRAKYLEGMNQTDRNRVLGYDKVDNAMREVEQIAKPNNLVLDPASSKVQLYDKLNTLVDAWKRNPNNNHTLVEFDQLKRQLRDIGYAETRPNSPERRMVDQLAEAAKSTIPDQKYVKTMEQYENATRELNDLTKEMTVRGGSTGANVRKLIKNQDAQHKSELMKRLSEINPDIPYMIAGQELNPLIPTGIRGQIAGVLSSGAMFLNPGALAGVALASPKVGGALNYGVGRVSGMPSRLYDAHPIIGRTIPQAGRAEEIVRETRATGGRIGSDSKADKLVRAAEMAKKDISKGTEALLDQPDETITRALAVAKKHI